MLHSEANLQVNLKFDVPFTPKKRNEKWGVGAGYLDRIV